MAEDGREIVSEVGTYTAATVLTKLIGVVAAVLTRRFLGPVQMGIWSVIQLVLIYASYTRLGTHTAASREVPSRMGQSQAGEADAIKNEVFTFSIGTAVLAGGFVLLAALCLQGAVRPEIFMALVFGALFVVLQRINNLYVCFARAYRHFSLISTQMVASTIVNVVLIAFLAYHYRIYGFMWAMFFSFLFNIGYFAYYRKITFRWTWRFSRLRPLVGFGIPLMFFDLVNRIFTSVDRIMILAFLGLRAMGLYSVALLVFGFLVEIPNAIGVVMIPNLEERYGQHRDISRIREFIDKWVLVYANTLPLLIGLAWLSSPFLVTWFLPEYSEAIPAVRLLAVGSFFLALTYPHSNFMITLRKYSVLFPIIAVSCFLLVILNGLFIYWNFGILGVAAATTLAFFCRYVLTFLATSIRVRDPRSSLFRFFAVLSKFAYGLATAVLLGHLSVTGNETADLAAQCLVFVLLQVPFLLQLERTFKLSSTVRKKLKGEIFDTVHTTS